MRYWDLGDWIGFLTLALIGALVLGLCTYGAVDAVQERRAFVAMVACRVRRMDPARQSLSATVVCIPVATRQDTTTVQVR